MKAHARKYCPKVERTRPDQQILVHDRNCSGSLGVPSVCAGSCAGSERNLLGGGEFGIGVMFLALLQISIMLVASGLSIWFFSSNRVIRLSITILVFLGSFVLIFHTVSLAINCHY